MLQTSQSDESIELVRETSAEMFVINLCASTTPVTLAHPATADLKRFTFFVTRRREEGRERFRLHMGYFATLAEAESMLAAVRDVYPAAWAGPAPENRAQPARAPARPAMSVVPPAQPAAVAPVVAAPVPAAPSLSPKLPALSLDATEPALVDAAPVAAKPVVSAPAASTSSPAKLKAPDALEAMSNVREVLAQLTDEPPAAPRAAAVAKLQASVMPRKEVAALTPAETLRVLETPVAAPKPASAPTSASAAKAAPAMPVAPPAAVAPFAPVAPLAATTRAPVGDIASSSSVNNIRVLTPEDTQTLRDIKLDEQRNAPASFAVQLVWAVQPIDMDAQPHLAIFDAYTLYHVEGSRQGRKWYGLRLGFFSDPSSAKQVAQYVRSEYASVAVVPVTGKEKDGAKAPTLSAAVIQQQPAVPRNETPKIPTVKPLEKPAPKSGLEGFELLPDEPVAKKRDLDDAMADVPAKGAAPKGPPRATGKAPGKRAVVRQTSKPSPPGAPQPLESTLEILGASTLTIDESREIINDAAARRPPPKKDKPGRFARLLNRLSTDK